MKSYFRFFALTLLFVSCIQDLQAQNMLNLGVTGGGNRYSNRSDNTKFPWGILYIFLKSNNIQF